MKAVLETTLKLLKLEDAKIGEVKLDVSSAMHPDRVKHVCELTILGQRFIDTWVTDETNDGIEDRRRLHQARDKMYEQIHFKFTSWWKAKEISKQFQQA